MREVLHETDPQGTMKLTAAIPPFRARPGRPFPADCTEKNMGAEAVCALLTVCIVA